MKHPNRIREIRETKGLTLDQVAAGAQTSNQQISKLEKGDRGLDLEWMIRVARGLGCEVWELLPPSALPPDVREFIRDYLDLTPGKREAARIVVREMQPAND